GARAARRNQVAAGHGAAPELGVREADAGVDDVRVDAGAGLRVRVAAGERQARSVDAVEAPRRRRLDHVRAYDLVLLDVRHAWAGAGRAHRVRRERAGEAADRAVVEEARAEAEAAGELVHDAIHVRAVGALEHDDVGAGDRLPAGAGRDQGCEAGVPG